MAHDLRLLFKDAQSATPDERMRTNAPFESSPRVIVGNSRESDDIVHSALPIDGLQTVHGEVRENVLQTEVIVWQRRGDDVRRVRVVFDLFVHDLEESSENVLLSWCCTHLLQQSVDFHGEYLGCVRFENA